MGRNAFRNSLLAVFAAYAVGSTLLLFDSPVVPETEPPEQSHHVIFVWVCGQLEFVMVDHDPTMTANRHRYPSEEMLEVIRTTPEERIVEMAFWDHWCPSQPERQ